MCGVEGGRAAAKLDAVIYARDAMRSLNLYLEFSGLGLDLHMFMKDDVGG